MNRGRVCASIRFIDGGKARIDEKCRYGLFGYLQSMPALWQRRREGSNQPIYVEDT